MLKHILLEGLEHRLEHFAENQSLDQHTRLHGIIDVEKAACQTEKVLSTFHDYSSSFSFFSP